MIQSKKMHPLLFSFLLLSPALITACSDQKEPYASHPKQTNDPTHDLKAQIEAKPIKTFKSTVHDLDDIALLSEYEQNFNAISLSCLTNKMQSNISPWLLQTTVL